jgi:hypothetical protein
LATWIAASARISPVVAPLSIVASASVRFANCAFSAADSGRAMSVFFGHPPEGN